MSKTTRSSDLARNPFRPTRRAVLALAAGAPFVLTAVPAWADPLDGPRNAGLVGEGADGYAIARDGAGADVRSLVDGINAKRRSFYEGKAAEEGVPVSDIQQIYREAIFKKAPSGWWFLTDTGWIQK